MFRRTVARLPMAVSAKRYFSDFLPDLIITKAASKQLNALNSTSSPPQHLRVAVEGGGCSGFQYVITLESEELDEDDQVYEKEGAKVVVDSTSMELLKGSTIDFAQELIRSSFTIINNPNAVSGCGCGSSFELKE